MPGSVSFSRPSFSCCVLCPQHSLSLRPSPHSVPPIPTAHQQAKQDDDDDDDRVEAENHENRQRKQKQEEKHGKSAFILCKFRTKVSIKHLCVSASVFRRSVRSRFMDASFIQRRRRSNRVKAAEAYPTSHPRQGQRLKRTNRLSCHNDRR